MMLETSWLWFVISKEYVELTRPKIESRDPIFFTGTRSRSRVSGNDRLFPRGSEFGSNLEIPAGPAIQLRPGPDYLTLAKSNSLGPATNFGKTHVGPVNLLYVIMFKIRKIKPNLSSVRQKPKSFHGDWLQTTWLSDFRLAEVAHITVT